MAVDVFLTTYVAARHRLGSGSGRAIRRRRKLATGRRVEIKLREYGRAGDEFLRHTVLVDGVPVAFAANEEEWHTLPEGRGQRWGNGIALVRSES